MIRNAVIIGLGATLLAACVPVQPNGPNPPAGPAPQAETTTNAEPAEGQPLAPVDVRKLTCRTLTGATDDDKAYATSFLLGYRSALVHSRTIEIKRIEAVEEAALADCVGKPDALATKVFAAALAKIGPGGEVREPPRVHHREPPSQATPGGTTPEQQPPAETHEPPIQYTPVQTAPTPPAPTQAAPTQAAPTQTTPHEAAPPQAAPPQAAPTQAAPTQAAPTQAAPTQAEPTQAAPTPAEPTQAAPPPAAPAEPAPAPKPAPATGEQKQ